jgi:hypothetical protein
VKRNSACLITATLLLACACSQQTTKKSREVEVDSPDKIQHAYVDPGQDPENKSASSTDTHEDLGSVVTLMSPLLEMQKQANLGASAAPVRHGPAPQVDRNVYTKADARRLLQTEFSVIGHTQIAFVVPAHQENPRVKGSYRAFVKGATTGPTEVDLMLLTAKQFDDFSHGRPWDVTMQIDPAHNQVVNWLLAPTYEQPVEYHLVFGNTGGHPKTKSVKADFSISFE